MARIDHVLYAVRDFGQAASWLRQEFGLTAVEGGRHSGWGTANWIVPLGDSYVELISVIDEDEASRSLLGQRVGGALERNGDHLFGWCVAPDDFEASAARADLTPAGGSRQRPDGTTVSWRTAGVPEALEDPALPFFIAWDIPASMHPGRMAAEHVVTPDGIAWVEVRGDAGRIAGWLGGETLPMRLRPGDPPQLLAVGISTRGGDELVLPPSP